MRAYILFLAILEAIPAATVKLPGSPFKIAISSDGAQIYASMTGAGLAVLERSKEGHVKVTRTIKTESPITGLALTHDGKTLIATNGSGVLLIDTNAWKIQAVEEKEPTGSVYVNITQDDKTVFVSNERAYSITVIDLPTRSILGRIPTGNAPIALTFSPDERLLYTTSQGAMKDWNWPAVCDAENPAASGAAKHPKGAILVIDVAAARKDPAHAVIKRVEAGCNPVRLALSPDGQRAYVTARKDNALLVFDTGTFSKLAEIPVGTAPVPVAVVKSGKAILVGNSNRFGDSKPQSISVIDSATNRVAGTLPAGSFPRDIVLSPDGRTLYVANFRSNSIDILATADLP